MKEKLTKTISAVIVIVAMLAVVGLCIAMKIYGTTAKFHVIEGTASFGEWAFVTAPVWVPMLLMAMSVAIVAVKSVIKSRS